MKAADRLSQSLGANISESMGGKRSEAEGAPASNPFPTGALVHGGPGAEKFRGAARVKDAFAIELDRIVPDPYQPRKEFDPIELDRLADSLQTRGQLQPIRVRYDESNRKWVIVSGERRYRAARLAGLPTIVCVEALYEPRSEEITVDQLVENCVREDLKPIEQARAFKRLLDSRGYSYRHLADTLNISHQAVVRALALLALPPDIQEKVDSGALSASAASEVSRLDDPAEQRAIVARVEAGAMTRDDVTRAVKLRGDKAKTEGGGKAKGHPPVDDRSRRASNQVKVRIEATARHTLADVVAALREVADTLESRPEDDTP